MRDAVVLAFAQLRAQKLKSACTLAGVTIGVMCLIAVVSVVTGMHRYMERDVAGKFLGVDAFTLRKAPDGDAMPAELRAFARRPNLTAADAYAVRDALPADAAWAIQDVRSTTPRTRYATGGPEIVAQAVTPALFAIKDLRVARGRTFTAEDEALGAPIAVIGPEVATLYFPGVEPLGRDILVDRLPFRVVGVLEPQGTVLGVSLDRQLFAPFRSPLRHQRGPGANLTGVVVQGLSPADRAALQETVREVMRRRHALRPDQADDFALENSTAALTQWRAVEPYLVLAGVVLPAVGLVVGGIVITNIMLVAVSQRTREIGVRLSLGARRRDILRQFLAEATLVSALGATLGVGLGAGLARAVAAATPLPAAVAPWSVLAAVALGAGIGMTAGAYPAGRAARLDPVAALRAE